MQNTSDIYKALFAALQAGKPDVRYETRLTIGDAGRLITKQGEGITFGGVSILVGSKGADGGYNEDRIVSIKTMARVFSEDSPAVGSCVSGEIDVEMLKPLGDIPRQARLVPYIRLTDGAQHSEWIQKGVYFTDTRASVPGQTFSIITLHGYDAMLKAEQDYPPSTMDWPAKDIDVVREIAQAMDVAVDARTVEIMNRGYRINYPAEYSQREVLGYLASMYAGSFVMSDQGELLLVQLAGIPAETRYLVAEDRSAITFGGVRILV